MTTRQRNMKDDLFQPIRVEKVSEKVAKQIMGLIADGVLKVGDRLPSERDLAERMGVSRTSVREALQQLEAKGIIQIVHGGGSIIQNVTAQDIQKPIELYIEQDKRRVLELAELRAVMEAWAAREAAKNRTEQEVETIREYLEEMEKDLLRGVINYKADFRYHLEIASATHNGIYLHIIDNIYNLIYYSIKIHRETVFTGKEAQEKILDHHRKIFRGIKNGDPDEAESAMREHLEFVVQEFKRKYYPELLE
ncbi:MAG: FadR family transcriptional regulator [Deltaproteobacteria bacterium]|nr:MAG: FadR family transcriptional regulator [Deltaproteobacteria bacterium]